ncbi:deoxyribodipyrimidine photo-lyase [Haladaptatus sp. F3-133]|uniref:Deoxyribodipyrimidine photo-lyase n=1 Tax=Halorutilus salinus TaxID=2487751 RepID=A0A9Q4C4D6_9EURY|nr:deoxyribodipyrimidine photo-lyase [Halorutilus salinus]MCX2818785.1 deoxyribodipyrimidine photo-lyase [Halorutilus salinus]
MDIHWHRRDLRVADNTALSRASEPLPVFILDDGVLEHASPVRVSFLLDALRSLREDYRALGGDLVVERGDPREVLRRLADEHGADTVVWNRDYSPLARERDDEVGEALRNSDVGTRTFADGVLHEPDEIFTNAGDPYSVFTYYHRKWEEREKDEPRDKPDEVRNPAVGGIPTVDELGFDSPEPDAPEGGTGTARELLNGFLSDGVYVYDEARDYPARGCTSRLSPHLKFGTVGVREVWEKTQSAKEDAEDDEERESVEEFQAQLAWREFYTQVLYHNPSVVTENYKTYENRIDWRNDEDEIRAWKQGETGYPIVDAGMRQLLDEGYVHNRIRMVVASFLTKDLLVDWRVGYGWFREKLVDHDTANDNGGWQWAASTGTDAQPYFRIFNPMTQGERYDPDGEYIKRYVPELRDVPADSIHTWHELGDEERDEAAPGYPAPIVDHSERREEALSMFEEARGDD